MSCRAVGRIFCEGAVGCTPGTSLSLINNRSVVELRLKLCLIGQGTRLLTKVKSWIAFDMTSQDDVRLSFTAEGGLSRSCPVSGKSCSLAGSTLGSCRPISRTAESLPERLKSGVKSAPDSWPRLCLGRRLSV